jgi:hypothetical protein
MTLKNTGIPIGYPKPSFPIVHRTGRILIHRIYGCAAATDENLKKNGEGRVVQLKLRARTGSSPVVRDSGAEVEVAEAV